MSQPIHLSISGTGGAASPDYGQLERLVAEDMQRNYRVTLCGATCGSAGHWPEEDVVQPYDTGRRDDLAPGGPEHDRLCDVCVAVARTTGHFDWITDGKPLPSDDPEARRMLGLPPLKPRP
jgi:hypothetical protein